MVVTLSTSVLFRSDLMIWVQACALVRSDIVVVFRQIFGLIRRTFLYNFWGVMGWIIYWIIHCPTLSVMLDL